MSAPKKIGWILGTIKSAGLVRLIRLTRLKKNCNRPIYMLYLDVKCDLFCENDICTRRIYISLDNVQHPPHEQKIWQKVIIDDIEEDEKWEMAAP